MIASSNREFGGPIRAGILLFGVLSSSICHADYWLGPGPRIYSSQGGELALKVIPVLGKDNACTSKATSVILQPDASDKVLDRFELINCPMRVLVPDLSVPFFVTLDTHGHVGLEHTLVIYRSGGKLVRDFKLEDILTMPEIVSHTKLTMSSRWWREGVTFAFDIPSTQSVPAAGDRGVRIVTPEPELTRLRISFPWGKQVVIRLTTGEVLP